MFPLSEVLGWRGFGVESISAFAERSADVDYDIDPLKWSPWKDASGEPSLKTLRENREIIFRQFRGWKKRREVRRRKNGRQKKHVKKNDENLDVENWHENLNVEKTSEKKACHLWRGFWGLVFSPLKNVSFFIYTC